METDWFLISLLSSITIFIGFIFIALLFMAPPQPLVYIILCSLFGFFFLMIGRFWAIELGIIEY